MWNYPCAWPPESFNLSNLRLLRSLTLLDRPISMFLVVAIKCGLYSMTRVFQDNWARTGAFKGFYPCHWQQQESTLLWVECQYSHHALSIFLRTRRLNHDSNVPQCRYIRKPTFVFLETSTRCRIQWVVRDDTTENDRVRPIIAVFWSGETPPAPDLTAWRVSNVNRAEVRFSRQNHTILYSLTIDWYSLIPLLWILRK